MSYIYVGLICLFIGMFLGHYLKDNTFKIKAKKGFLRIFNNKKG